MIRSTLKRNCRKWTLFDQCNRERENTKGRLFKLTNVTVSSALLKAIHMGCKRTVLPQPILKNSNVSCLTFERNTRQPYNDNLCLFRGVALHLQGNEKLEEGTSETSNLLLLNWEEKDPSKFQAVHMNDIRKIEDMLQLTVFVHNFGFVDGKRIHELARRSA